LRPTERTGLCSQANRTSSTEVSWRIGGKIGISVGAYRSSAKNAKPALRELAAHTLAEFDLTGEID